MKAAEELQRLHRLPRNTRCLVALSPAEQLDDCDPDLLVGNAEALVGTLDVLTSTRSPAEVLIGKQRSAVYMMNVCTAEAARRRGVGQRLVDAAVQFARDAGGC